MSRVVCPEVSAFYRAEHERAGTVGHFEVARVDEPDIGSKRLVLLQLGKPDALAAGESVLDWNSVEEEAESSVRAGVVGA